MENKSSKDVGCEKCPLQFVNQAVLNMHMVIVHKIKAKKSNTKMAVVKENKNSGEESPIKPTDVIGEQQVSVNKNKTHSNVNKKTHSCSICENSFSRKDTLNKHVKYVHEKRNSIVVQFAITAQNECLTKKPIWNLFMEMRNLMYAQFVITVASERVL